MWSKQDFTLERYCSRCIMHALRGLHCVMVLLTNGTSYRRNTSRTMMFIQNVHWVARSKRIALWRVKRVASLVPKAFSLSCAFVDRPLRDTRWCNHAGARRDSSSEVWCLKQIPLEVISVLVNFLVYFLLTQMISWTREFRYHARKVNVT